MKFILVAAAVFAGWVVAHNVIAHECKTLKAFYVGSGIYECKLKGSK